MIGSLWSNAKFCFLQFNENNINSKNGFLLYNCLTLLFQDRIVHIYHCTELNAEHGQQLGMDMVPDRGLNRSSKQSDSHLTAIIMEQRSIRKFF